jgi:hypothetical protein
MSKSQKRGEGRDRSLSREESFNCGMPQNRKEREIRRTEWLAQGSRVTRGTSRQGGQRAFWPACRGYRYA